MKTTLLLTVASLLAIETSYAGPGDRPFQDEAFTTASLRSTHVPRKTSEKAFSEGFEYHWQMKIKEASTQSVRKIAEETPYVDLRLLLRSDPAMPEDKQYSVRFSEDDIGQILNLYRTGKLQLSWTQDSLAYQQYCVHPFDGFHTLAVTSPKGKTYYKQQRWKDEIGHSSIVEYFADSKYQVEYKFDTNDEKWVVEGRDRSRKFVNRKTALRVLKRLGIKYAVQDKLDDIGEENSLYNFAHPDFRWRITQEENTRYLAYRPSLWVSLPLLWLSTISGGILEALRSSIITSPIAEESKDETPPNQGIFRANNVPVSLSTSYVESLTNRLLEFTPYIVISPLLTSLSSTQGKHLSFSFRLLTSFGINVLSTTRLVAGDNPDKGTNKVCHPKEYISITSMPSKEGNFTCYDNLKPIVIIGGGIAGLSAAGRAEEFSDLTTIFMGPNPGGALLKIGDCPLENKTPFVPWRTGQEIVNGLMRYGLCGGNDGAQSDNWCPLQPPPKRSIHVDWRTVGAVDFDNYPFKLTLDDNSIAHALTIILATGTNSSRLYKHDIHSEGRQETEDQKKAELQKKMEEEDECENQKLLYRDIDCKIPRFTEWRSKTVAIIGDGPDAIRKARIVLSADARKVTVVGSNKTNDQVQIAWKSLENQSNGRLLRWKGDTREANIRCEEKEMTFTIQKSFIDENKTSYNNLTVDRVVVATGPTFNTSLIRGPLYLAGIDDKEYVATNRETLRALRKSYWWWWSTYEIFGVFAAGDIVNPKDKYNTLLAAAQGEQAMIEAKKLFNNTYYHDIKAIRETIRNQSSKSDTKELLLKQICCPGF